ncbi:MAG: cellulase family glycosylhydrolase [Acidobacteriia bacterium]|nr:cellulase family glycosylhydrolase [Terriglobia bacterium]
MYPRRETGIKPAAKSSEATAAPRRDGHLGKPLSRRSVLKSLTARAGLAAMSPAFAGQAPNSAAKPSASTLNHRNPRWYGFNLLEYFSTDPDWMKYFPYKNDGNFVEDDFRWIRDWGFNFVRLPMDYRFWTDPIDPMKIDERKIEPIDRAIRLGEKYGVHVNISLHRAPGFCILDGLDPAVTGIPVTPEKTSFYKDPHTLDAFVHQWTFFAQRYKGTSNDRLSFNLVNEPDLRPTPEEKTQLAERLKKDPAALTEQDINALGEKEYARVARAAIEGIRAIDAQRVIVSDGCAVAKTPVADLFSCGVVQSPHDYIPSDVTFYRAEWARGDVTRTEPPTWPLKDSRGRVTADRKSIEDYFRPWRAMEQLRIPIHFGEMGCYKHTPPQVALAWFEDTLDVIGELSSGWALWNFRGPFGVLDTERAGTKYQDWHGHQLDRPLLDLLRKKMRT